MPGDDPVGMMDPANKTYLSIDFMNPKVRAKAATKLAELIREIPRVHEAALQFERDLRAGVPFDAYQGPFGHQAARSKAAMRNWVLSLVESLGYIERLIGGPEAELILLNLLGTATNLGVDRAMKDRNAIGPGFPKS
jgi:hypothetical protein